MKNIVFLRADKERRISPRGKNNVIYRRTYTMFSISEVRYDVLHYRGELKRYSSAQRDMTLIFLNFELIVAKLKN